MKKFLILFCAFLVFVSACRDDASKIDELAVECTSGDQKACKKLADIAKKDKEWEVRKAAVEKLIDQELLVDIAKNDKEWNVRMAAVEKLTDQAVLADIAKNDEEGIVRIATVENPNLNDQSVLTEIAKKDENEYVRKAAFKKLADQVLAKIALEDLSLGDIAFKKLAAQASWAKASVDDKDWRVRLILKFIAAFDSVPSEHRGRLMMEVLPAVRVLIYPEVVSAVGDIVSIKTEWNSTSQYYIGSSSGNMQGEIFTCSIKVQKLPEPLSHTWRTSFPSTTSFLVFSSAEVNTADLLRKLFEKLTDQKILTDIARNDSNSDVREAAVKKLTDQKILADIARNDEDRDVRVAAVDKLTDQKLLYEIAMKDKDEYIRMVAERRLKYLQGK